MLMTKDGIVTKLIVCADSEGKRCEVYPVFHDDPEDEIEDFLESLKQTDDNVWVCEHQLVNIYAAEDKEDKW